jgi:hypothetical protein
MVKIQKNAAYVAADFSYLLFDFSNGKIIKFSPHLQIFQPVFFTN